MSDATPTRAVVDTPSGPVGGRQSPTHGGCWPPLGDVVVEPTAVVVVVELVVVVVESATVVVVVESATVVVVVDVVDDGIVPPGQQTGSSTGITIGCDRVPSEVLMTTSTCRPGVDHSTAT